MVLLLFYSREDSLNEIQTNSIKVNLSSFYSVSPKEQKHYNNPPNATDTSNKTDNDTTSTNEPNEIDSNNKSIPEREEETKIPENNTLQNNEANITLSLQKDEEFKNDSENSEWIFRTSSNDDNRCIEKDQRLFLLCNIGIKCKSQYLTEQLSTFWIICPIYSANHEKTALLYNLHRNFRSYIQSYGINFQTVEVIFPGQEFQLTKPNNEPYDLQYTDKWIFAMRENLVNVGIKHLPNDWEYVAWIDQHIFWMDPYWFEKSIWLMSHYNIVHLLNGSDFWNLHNATDYSLKGVINRYYEIGDNYWYYAPQQWGLAWATQKEIFEKLGGLLDICIGTKCDFYQAGTYTGKRYNEMTLNQEFNDMIGAWQDHAIEVYQRKVGFLDSKVIHFMHCVVRDGCQTSDYDGQITLLFRFNFTPRRDLVRDAEGRLSLVNDPLGKEFWKKYGGEPRE